MPKYFSLMNSCCTSTCGLVTRRLINQHLRTIPVCVPGWQLDLCMCPRMTAIPVCVYQDDSYTCVRVPRWQPYLFTCPRMTAIPVCVSQDDSHTCVSVPGWQPPLCACPWMKAIPVCVSQDDSHTCVRVPGWQLYLCVCPRMTAGRVSRVEFEALPLSANRNSCKEVVISDVSWNLRWHPRFFGNIALIASS